MTKLFFYKNQWVSSALSQCKKMWMRYENFPRQTQWIASEHYCGQGLRCEVDEGCFATLAR
jgi:hypothetical protein